MSRTSAISQRRLLPRPPAAGPYCVPAATVLGLAFALTFAGCDRAGRRSYDEPTPAPATRPAARPSVASLVPAATDLLLDMGAGDHLVAVSNYDIARDPIRGLPRVGDYETVDWERIATLRPELMVTQYAEARMPQGMRQREQELGVRPVNVHIDTLGDIFAAYGVLGEAVGERDKADRAEKALRDRLDRLRRRTGSLPKVSVLIAIDSTGLHLAGPGTFLDDLLPYAGATDAAASLKSKYPAIDREMLRALAPDVIVQLLPNESPQVVEQAKRVWEGMPELKAVKNGKVVAYTDWYLLQPGPRVAEVAEAIASAAHPELARPTTNPAPITPARP